MRFWVLLVVFVLTLVGSLGFRAVSHEPRAVLDTRPLLDPTQAVVTLAANGWSVWRMQDMLGDSQRSEKRTIHTRLFRQRAGGETAELVYESFEHPIPQVWGVLSDGTVVVGQSNQIVLVDRLGVTRAAPLALPGFAGRGVMVNAAIDEGLFLQPAPQEGKPNVTPVFFVPFRDGRLDGKQAVEITRGEGVRVRLRRPMARAGQEVAWHDERGLHIFDLVSTDVREIDYGDKPRPHYDEVRGFDGRYIMLRQIALDLETGQQVAKLKDTYPIILRGGVLYELIVERNKNRTAATMILQARDLSADPKQPIEMRRLKAYEFYWSYGNRRQPMSSHARGVVQALEQGLHLFDGDAWITVPYLGPHQDPVMPPK